MTPSGSDSTESAIRSRVARVVDGDPTAVTELDGGMIGTVYRVDRAHRAPVVAKVGNTPLTVEARMLRMLASESDLPLPTVLHASDDLLVLTHEAGCSTTTPAVERDLAEHLARLHDVSGPAFGFPFDTLTGPLDLPNPWTDSWVDFYREYRLLHFARDAREHGPLTDAFFDRICRVADDLPAVIDAPQSPALIHGDAWTNNLLACDGELVAFLDPACYYAHPEVELAYVDWTDTGGEDFFERYRTHCQIPDGFFDTRRHVYALLPILVHVRLFGDAYLDDLDRALDRLGY